MRLVSGLILSALLLGVALAAEPPKPSDAVIRQIGGEKVAAIIRAIESTEAFHVGGVDVTKIDPAEVVGNRVIVGKGIELPKDFAAKLTAALFADDTYFKNDSKGTGKNTAVAFRAKTAKGEIVEVSCCLEKGNTHLRIVDAAGKVLKSGDVRGCRNAEAAPLRILAAEVFPDDPIIQKFKPKPAGEKAPVPAPKPPAPPGEKPAEKPPVKASAENPKSPFEPGAKVAMVAEGFKFAEGPTSDKTGNVYFSDQPNDRIMIWSVDGKLSTFVEKCGRANGLCFDADGKLWACSDEKNELRKYDVATKDFAVVVEAYMDKLLNGPNDVWASPKGGVYFTDPFYNRTAYWKRGPEEQDKRGVYYVSPKGALSRVADDFVQPNGIVGTPDGKTLYVADIRGKRTFAFDIKEDGTLEKRRVFCGIGSDGLTIDDEGNVYLTGGGINVFDKTGKKITTLAVPEGAANMCFGGMDRKTLFITAQKSLYAVPMRVAGASQ